MFGHLARMVVFGLVGVFLIKAAVDYNPNEAIGLDGALAKLANHSYGPYLLGDRRGRPDRVRPLLAHRRALPPDLSRAASSLAVRGACVPVCGRLRPRVEIEDDADPDEDPARDVNRARPVRRRGRT